MHPERAGNGRHPRPQLIDEYLYGVLVDSVSVMSMVRSSTAATKRHTSMEAGLAADIAGAP
jgi:hypothetical protein